jgi:hypothetical protein
MIKRSQTEENVDGVPLTQGEDQGSGVTSTKEAKQDRFSKLRSSFKGTYSISNFLTKRFSFQIE